MNVYIRRLQAQLNKDFSLTAMKLIGLSWLAIVAYLIIIVENKWLLAGILAYELLP